MTDNMRNEWLDMIAKVYSNLHNTDRVLKAASLSDKKRVKLAKFFDRMDRVHKHISDTKSVDGDIALKHFYHELYVIKPQDIPDAYFQSQVKIARERGYGNIELTENEKKEMAKQVIDDQKRTLDNWIDYFLYDEESKSYEMWEKYWVFQGLQELGKYDKEKGKFSKRDKTTVYPFPPVEREFIFTTLKLMEDFLKSRKSDDEIRNALNTGNFKQIYEYVIKQSLLRGERKSIASEGKWIKYEQGSDYQLLYNSLQGFYTGWCTAAGENFAKNQIAGGDFYVYYSLDENNEAKVPRIAIRMDGKNMINEIRGIAENQNMEPEMLPVLEEKLKDFSDRESYLKKEHDMKLLTLIDKKVNNNFELDLDELKFLYEINGNIDGFGHKKDPRINEIIGKRNIKKDYSYIYNILENRITDSYDEWFNNQKKYDLFVGNLQFNIANNSGEVTFPRIVHGNVTIWGSCDAKSVNFPEVVNGILSFPNLTDGKNYVLPRKVKHLLMDYLTDASEITFPKEVDTMSLRRLEKAKRLVLPEKANVIFLSSLKEASGLKFPRYVESLYLSHLRNTKGIVFPDEVLNLELLYVTEIKDTKLPRKVGSLLLDSLTTLKNGDLPEEVTSLSLPSIKELDGINFPNGLKYLDLTNLISAKGVVFPEGLEFLNLLMLESVEGLVLPKSITTVYLNNIISVEGLKLPIGFDLNNLYCNMILLDKIKREPYKYFMNQTEKRTM